jgi:hypothetical protein
VGVLFYSRSDGQYSLVSEIIMAVFFFIILCDVPIDRGCSFLLQNLTQYILVSEIIMAVFFFYYYTEGGSVRQWTFFSICLK